MLHCTNNRHDTDARPNTTSSPHHIADTRTSMHPVCSPIAAWPEAMSKALQCAPARPHDIAHGMGAFLRGGISNREGGFCGHDPTLHTPSAYGPRSRTTLARLVLVVGHDSRRCRSWSSRRYTLKRRPARTDGTISGRAGRGKGWKEPQRLLQLGGSTGGGRGAPSRSERRAAPQRGETTLKGALLPCDRAKVDW